MNKVWLWAAMLACLACSGDGFAQKSAEGAAQKPPTQPTHCAPAAFLTFESGKLAGVDWVKYGTNQVHTRIVLTQSRVVDATIDLRPDQTAAHSSVVLSIAGDDPEKPKARDLGEGAIYWSDFIV